MPAITIRNIDDATKHRLRLRAAEHGHSMEEEARAILRAAVADDSTPETGLGSAIHALFAEQGGVELDLPPRAPGREPPNFT